MKKFIFASSFLLFGCYNTNTLVYHSTAFDAKKAIETYEEYDVSVHYIVEKNGNVIQMIDDDKDASHAGTSYWRGYDRINPRSVGIEVLQDDLGQKPYSKQQIDAVIKLSLEIIKKYNINPKMIVGHSDISPNRKADPGKCFPWKKMAENNIGLWYYLPDANKVATNDACKMLEDIGYDISDFSAAQYAFARRYVPELVKTEKIDYLIETPYPKDFDATNNKKFMQILKAVYYRYSLPQCFN